MKKLTLAFIIGLAVAACAAAAVFYSKQDGMIFFPDEPADEDIMPTPTQFEKVNVETSDGLRLMALYFPGDKLKPAILWNHGNAFDVWKLGFILRPYIDAGFPVYMTEYRGFGGNPGKFSEEGFIRDIAAGWDFLKSKGHDKIIIHGYSMGCALSARFAATVRQPVALVLEAPFETLAHMARHRKGNIPLIGLFLKYEMNTAKHAKGVSAPTLVIHGDADETVPIAQARAVYESAAAARKDFIIVPGGTHRLFKSGSYEIIMDWLGKNM
jgi:dipeptidyl aminopeptidase/acylaminoacyl peptidase